MADTAELRREALAALGRGQAAEAGGRIEALLSQTRDTPAFNPRDQMLLGYALFQQERLDEALVHIEAFLGHAPRDLEAINNRIVILQKQNRFDEAYEALQLALEIDPENEVCLSLLCDLSYRRRDLDAAREAGRKVLALRASQGTPSDFDPEAAPFPAFDPLTPTKNVIAFSLWGDKPRYLDGAVRNVRVAPDLYPSWRLRFYIDDSVPERLVQLLLAENADVIVLPRQTADFDGLYWRFLVADDPVVDRYLIRDVDSVLNVQERVAVDAWLASDKRFHVMRDWWTHTEPMLAGMWGGTRGALPPLAPLWRDFRAVDGKNVLMGRIIDQVFLRKRIWPIARKSVLQHDSIFRYDGADDFPVTGRRGLGMHVGQDDVIFRKMRAGTPKGRLMKG